MNDSARFSQHLADWLHEEAVHRVPDHLSAVLVRTAATPQRPWWASLGRWFPMADIAHQPAFAPRLPLRTIGLALVLLALLVALVATLIVGQRSASLPPPYGPAANGLVAYASYGDIYTADPVTGQSKAIVSGPETDLDPRWSRDGTRLAFERKAQGSIGPGLLYVVRADGADLVRVTPEPLSNIENYSFSPDGDELLVSAEANGLPAVFVAATDGSGIRQLDPGMPATNAAWRPPDGSEILIMEAGDNDSGFGGIHIVDAENGAIVRTLVERAAGHYRGHPRWSPDGSQLSYVEWVDDPNDITAMTHIVAADGAGDRVLPLPPGARWEAGFAWSNDGTRLLAIRGDSGGLEGVRPVVVPVDGSGTGLEIDYSGLANAECCAVWEWAPDDTSILGTPTGPSGGFLDQVLLDPVAGTASSVPWSSASRPSWQRLAR